MPIAHESETLLEFIGQALDISPSKYEQACARYKAVGEWLDAPNSSLKPFLPKVFPQGSFRLGTIVRPFAKGEDREYDIDLVCELQRDKMNVDPGTIKKDVADRLRANAHYARMLQPEGRRCWTLQYAEDDGIGFHLDTLPCVPEIASLKKQLISYGVPSDWATSAIAISDKDGSAYGWSAGNPEGYARWFETRNYGALARVSVNQKRIIFEGNRNLYASVERVPDQLVRTPLQRLIQTLKRHRDVRFDDDQLCDYRPISIIITTLAAATYEGQLDPDSAVREFIGRVRNVDAYSPIRKVNNEWLIPNPVNPRENFADKWNEDGGKRAKYFFEWLTWLEEDLNYIETQTSTTLREARIARAFKVSTASRRSSSIFVASAPGTKPNSLSGSTFSRLTHKETPPWPMDLRCSVIITGRMEHQGYRSREIQSNESRLPKRADLYFTAHTDASAPYQIYWQVVNSGEEAARADCLRGGIFLGRNERYETTLYTGRHTIQCYVVRNGICVAASRQFVVNIE